MSSRTDNSGRYSIAGLPAGTYDLGVEADGGVYVVGGPFSLSSGEQRTMGLSVRSASAAADGENMDEPAPAPPPTPPAPAEPPTPAPEQPTEPPKEPPKEAPKAEKPMPKKVKFWRAPWGGAAIVVGTAVIVGALASSNDEDKSANASPH